MARDIGDKLGPRLSSLFLTHNLALRRQLAPLEAKIAAAATQQLIDQAGVEVAGLWRPITRAVLQHHGDNMPAALAHIFSRMESGQHQWEAISGNLQMASTSALSSVLSNYLFPITGPLNQVSPNLPVDAQTGAAAVAAGLASYDLGVQNAAVWGNREDAFSIMYQLAQAVPGGAVLFDLRNRGLITDQDLNYWLTRAAVPPSLIGPVADTRFQLLSPADAALAVLRGNMTLDAGTAAAASAGVTANDFNILIGNTGEPLALEEMLLLYRWGKMDKATLERGILQSRIRDEWIPYAEQLGIIPPSGAEIIDALVRGQISQSEAEERWKVTGGDPTWFQTAYTSSSNPPSPTQLGEMAHRGIIPWHGTGPDAISFQQGIFEGDVKDKWEPYFEKLAVYQPPPREVSTLVKEGGLTQDQAESYWQAAGLTPELAHIYWTAAHYQKTTAIHELAQGEIVKLYTDRGISRDEALKLLESINWTATDAEYLLDIADFRLAAAAVEGAISKLKTLFVSYKIPESQVKSALAEIDVPATQAEQLISVWQLEREANLKTLTAAEITDAWYYQLVDPTTAQGMLESLGYTPYDAWLLLNIKNKGPIQNFPKPAGG